MCNTSLVSLYCSDVKLSACITTSMARNLALVKVTLHSRSHRHTPCIFPLRASCLGVACVARSALPRGNITLYACCAPGLRVCAGQGLPPPHSSERAHRCAAFLRETQCCQIRIFSSSGVRRAKTE
jgi:hypothetical protein